MEHEDVVPENWSEKAFVKNPERSNIESAEAVLDISSLTSNESIIEIRDLTKMDVFENTTIGNIIWISHNFMLF